MIILPSLEIVPAKYNTSTNTLLSQIPIDGTGDFTVSRTTSPVTGQSTRVNALGLIETVPDNVPRLDYPIGGGCPALLVEPSAQNALQRSSEFDDTYWGKQSGANVTPNDAISPDGTLNADRINLVSVSGSTISRVERAGLAYLASTDYTLSFFLKNISLTAGQTFAIRLEGSGGFDLVGTVTLFSNTISVALTGTAGTGFVSGSQKSTVENYGNGWYRYSISLRTGTTAGNATVYLIANVDANRSFHAWGAQLEANSIPTSYIPTVASGITRAADAISDTTATALIGQTEGTIYFEAQCFTPSNFSDIIRIEGVGSNNISIIQNANNAYRMDLTASGVSRIITSTVTGVTGFAKIAIAYKTNDLAISVNGGAPTTLASGFTFDGALTTIRIAHANYTALRPYRLRAAALYPTRLTDTQLALLTSPYTSYSSMALALSYTLG